MSPLARRVADRLLTAAAVLGLVGLLLAVAGPVADVRASQVLTGSMAPALPAGSLVVVRRVPTADVELGQVVQMRAAGGATVTHRVVGRAQDGLVLRGDANRSPDPEPYGGTHADRVILDVPHLGSVAGALHGPAGLALLGALGLGLLVLVVRPDLLDAGPRRGGPTSSDLGRAASSRRRGRLARGGVVAGVVGLALAGPHQAERAWATGWGDPVPATTTVVAHTVAPTRVTCSSPQLLRATITWETRPDATSYVLHYGLGGAVTETVGPGVTSKTVTLVGAGVFWVEVQHAYGGVTWTSVASNRLAYLILLDAVGSCADV